MGFNALLAVSDGFVTETLGEEVTYTPESEDAVSVFGVFDEAYVLVEAGDSGVSSSGPAIFFRLSDLPTTPDKSETITRNGVTYRARTIKPDGIGGVILLLHVDD